MPKAQRASSPPSPVSPSNATTLQSPLPRMSDVALRKKKNADAQAAFRARRANYIATLEETVTSLESVVLQLQESCRETRNESQELRQENSRLRHELREREKFWRALAQARKSSGHGPDSDDVPPAFPHAPFPQSQPPSNIGGHMSSHLHQYGNEALPYRTNEDGSAICNGSYPPGPSNAYQNHSPSLPFSGSENDVSGDAGSHSLTQRLSKFSPYPYPMPPARDGSWTHPHPITQSNSSGGESGGPNNNQSSHSPAFVESPTLTSSEMSYVGRFPSEDQKTPLLEGAPYVFQQSRSLSPTNSTPSSTSSTPLTSPFQFTFPDNPPAHERPDFDYRRQPHPHAHGAEVTLHGGTADISLSSPINDSVRFRFGPRRTNGGSERPMLPTLPALSGSDHGSPHERGSSDGDSTPYPHQPRLRARRGTNASRASRSPSPGGPPLSGTLAVIKAQAFGALRRTRARTKKTSEGAARVAMDVLEARGIGMGTSTGSKRPRTQNEDVDM